MAVQPNSVSYREALPEDIPALARIRSESWGTPPYWEQRIRGYLSGEVNPQQALAPRVLFVAVAGDTPIGLIAGHLTRRFQCDGELEWIDVSLARRRAGVASELLRRLAHWFTGQSARRICVDVEPSNTVARRFYARHGAIDLKPSWMVWEDIRRMSVTGE